MKKWALKLALPLVVLSGAVLVWSGAVELGDAVIVIAGLEALLLVAGAGSLGLVIRRYRRKRESGLDPWRALEDGLALILPEKAARLVTHEPRLFVSLLRWTFRRSRLTDSEFGYHKRSVLRAILPMVIVVAPVEFAVVHLLVHILSPWAWLQWALLALEIYGMLWLLGFYASLIVLPHRLHRGALQVHYGALAEATIPYAEIEAVTLEERKPPRSQDGLHHAAEENALYLAVGGRTSVTLRLRNPQSVRGFLEESAPALTMHFAVDESNRLYRMLNERLREAEETPVAL